MRSFLNFLVAASLLASAAFASESDPFREERVKAKTGRYTAAEEVRWQASDRAAAAGSTCDTHACCRRLSRRTQPSGWADRWFEAKWGRSLQDLHQPATVARVAASHHQSFAPGNGCHHPACCD